MSPLIRPGLLRNLQIGFGLSLLILIISSVASYSSIQNLLENSRWVDHTDSVISKLEYVISTMKDLETGQRGYLLTGDTVYLQPYNGSGPKALSTVDSIQQLTADNPVQQKNSEELRDVITRKINIVRGTIEQKMADNIYSVDDLKRGKGYMDRARDIVYRMSLVERSLLTERTIKMKKFAG
jgi:CHASE3 domain sensor protein